MRQKRRNGADPRFTWPRGGVAPQLALGASDALVVEGFGNGAWPNAGGEVTEDAADDFRLVGVDLAVAPDLFAFGVELPDDAIALAEAATGFAVLDPAAQAAMGLKVDAVGGSVPVEMAESISLVMATVENSYKQHRSAELT